MADIPCMACESGYVLLSHGVNSGLMCAIKWHTRGMRCICDKAALVHLHGLGVELVYE